LVVCVTNHALDNFLLDITKSVTKDIVRIGGTSKESWTNQYLLRALINESKSTKLDHVNRWRVKNCVESKTGIPLIRLKLIMIGLAAQGHSSCDSLTGSGLSWVSIEHHTKESYPEIYSQFAEIKVSGDRVRPRHQQNAARFGYESWARGTDLSSLESLEQEFTAFLGMDSQKVDSAGLVLIKSLLNQIATSARETDVLRHNTSVWSMSPQERNELARKWEEEIGLSSVLDRTVEIHCRHQAAVERLNGILDDQHARLLVKSKSDYCNPAKLIQ
jgi:hypothetical protein